MKKTLKWLIPAVLVIVVTAAVVIVRIVTAEDGSEGKTPVRTEAA